ncbi:MAG: metal-dependent hydrolase [Candidatus Buchananbacteria bacterium]
MILAHTLIGLAPLGKTEFFWYWFIGSVIADIDHLYIIIKYQLFSWPKLIDCLRFEKNYHVHFKTKYLHSILGAIILTLPLLLISARGASYFFVAYLLHLLLDWPDIDEKQYFYPYKLKIKGWLPIFSATEIIFTLVLIISLIYIFIKL